MWRFHKCECPECGASLVPFSRTKYGHVDGKQADIPLVFGYWKCVSCIYERPDRTFFSEVLVLSDDLEKALKEVEERAKPEWRIVAVDDLSYSKSVSIIALWNIEA